MKSEDRTMDGRLANYIKKYGSEYKDETFAYGVEFVDPWLMPAFEHVYFKTPEKAEAFVNFTKRIGGQGDCLF